MHRAAQMKNLAFAAGLLALAACSSELPETRSLAEARQGQDAALVGAADPAGHVGHHQTDAPGGPHGGGGRTAQQGDSDDHQNAGAPGVRAEGGGQVVTQRDSVQSAGPPRTTDPDRAARNR